MDAAAGLLKHAAAVKELEGWGWTELGEKKQQTQQRLDTTPLKLKKKSVLSLLRGTVNL